MKLSKSSSSPKAPAAKAPVISAKSSQSKVPSLKKNTVLPSKGRIKDTNTSKVYKFASKSPVKSLMKPNEKIKAGQISSIKGFKLDKLSPKQKLSANKRVQGLRSGTYKIKPFKSKAKDDGKHGARFAAAKRHKILKDIQDPNTPANIRGHYIQQIRRKGLSGYWSNPKGYDFGHKLHPLHRKHRDHPDNIELQDSSRNRRIGAKFKK